MNWCCCTVHFVLTGARGLTVDIFSRTCRGALSLRSLLGTHAESLRFFFFTTVHLPSPFAISSSLSGWDDSGRLFVARHSRIDGIIWKFCFGVCNLSWELYRSRLTYILLMTGGTKSISKGFGLLTPPSLPLSLGLGPCHLCTTMCRPKKADREATVWRLGSS